MNEVHIKLTVLFDDMFWVGIFEKEIDNKLYAFKYTFGAEPSEQEIYNFILSNHNLRYNSFIKVDKKEHSNINPKRLKRIVKKQVVTSIGTKSQQVLKMQQEENKTITKQYNKEHLKELNEKKYKLKLQKKLQKHKGR